MRLALLLSLLAAVAARTEQVCSYEPPDPSTVSFVSLDWPPNATREKRVAEEWQPLRIHVHYDRSVRALQPQQLEKVKRDTQAAIDYWQKTLSVKRAKRNLRLNRNCLPDPSNEILANSLNVCKAGCEQETMCDMVHIPKEHLMPCIHCPNSCLVNGKTAPADEFNALLSSEIEKTKGVDTDYIMYLAVDNGKCEEKFAANARHCQLDLHRNRPFAGRINVCASKIGDHELSSTIQHEVAHALAFSAGLYDYFWMNDTTPYVQRKPENRAVLTGVKNGEVRRKVVRKDWWTRDGRVSHSVDMIVTPHVVREVREHFACPTLEGAELENEGGRGTAGSHWEKRVFRNEMMTGIQAIIGRATTRVTLALMEDSGWYRANYSMAEPLHWGRGLGCSFVQKSCGEWMETRKKAGKQVAPFCDTLQGTHKFSCSANRESIGECDLTDLRNSPNPPQFRYFTQIEGVPDEETQFYGGESVQVDQCPYVKEFGMYHKTLHTPHRCGDISHASDTYGQEFGSHSRCIDFGGAWMKGNTVHKFNDHFENTSGCYKTKCTASALSISVSGSGKWYTCGKTEEGKRIDVETTSGGQTIRGSLICPAYNDICYEGSTAFNPIPERPLPPQNPQNPDKTSPSNPDKKATTSPQESSKKSSSSSSSSTPSAVWIAVGAVAGVLVLAVLGVVVYLYLRRKNSAPVHAPTPAPPTSILPPPTPPLLPPTPPPIKNDVNIGCGISSVEPASYD